MDILRSEVPQEPASANNSRREQDVTRILNPYDTEENLLSTTVSSSRTAIPPAIPVSVLCESCRLVGSIDTSGSIGSHSSAEEGRKCVEVFNPCLRSRVAHRNEGAVAYRDASADNAISKLRESLVFPLDI